MWEKIKKPVLALAPMAGVTDSAFRRLCREEGADVVYSEMASVAALHFKPEKTLELIRFSLEEQPYVVQLFGKEPRYFAEAAALVSKGIPVIKYGEKRKEKAVGRQASIKESGNNLAVPAGIDINFGCPARKVFGHGSGAALMDRPDLARHIIEAVVESTPLPVSIKVRSEVKGRKLLGFLREIKINSLGVAAIMVHGRSYSQGFSGPVDYATIQEVKKYFKGIVLANGGIKNLENAKTMLEKTGADGLGIATGAYGNPLFFRELKTLKEEGVEIRGDKIILADKVALARRQAAYVYELKGRRGILELRKHLIWYFKGVPGIKKLHLEMVQVSSLGEVKKVLEKIEKLF